MNVKSLFFGLIISAIFLTSYDNPKGWVKAGSEPDKYEMGIDKGKGYNCKNAATIQSIDKDVRGCGSLVQNFSPQLYLGQRIRLSGYVRSKDVSDWAGLWLVINQPGVQVPLSFDNMQDRPITGTTDWKKYEIVLDVPNNASNIEFGALLSGPGQIWFCNLSFEIVSNTIPTTGVAVGHRKEPINLTFDE